MEPHKIGFKNPLEPPINSYEYFKFEEYSDETHPTNEFLDYTKHFKVRYKIETLRKIAYDFLVKMIKKFQFLSKKSKKYNFHGIIWLVY